MQVFQTPICFVIKNCNIIVRPHFLQLFYLLTNFSVGDIIYFAKSQISSQAKCKLAFQKCVTSLIEAHSNR